ncbi:MAG: 2-C-methyl-D-erythritol 4-phosphate cytidylyltransferase [Solirubrobacterales bacterium]
MDKIWAVIVAAGKGKRMGAGINKQFIDLKGKPVLYYTLKAFSDNEYIDSIVLVCASDEISYCKKEIIEKYNFSKVKCVAEGGLERQHSVFNGLKMLTNCEIVIIHDGARPFVSKSIINQGIDFARKYGACACGVTPKDTIKLKDKDGFGKETLDRQQIFAVQTPQCFKYELIMGCYENLIENESNFTDDTSVAESFGHRVYLYEGSYNNIKITTPEDLALAHNILERGKF